MTPVLAQAAEQELNKKYVFILTFTKRTSGNENHHSILLDIIAKDLKVEASQIQDFELCLYDTQPASLGGANEEFIHSPRLDNLMMSFCSLEVIMNLC